MHDATATQTMSLTPEIEAAIETAAERTGTQRGHSALMPFAQRLLQSRHGAVLELPAAVQGALAVEAFGFICERPDPGPKLRHRRLNGDGNGTVVIEILNDDMPFLVTSVIAAVQGRGLAASHVLHPILVVERDGAGRLVALAETGSTATGGALSESLIVILIDEVQEEATVDAVIADLFAVLRDVRVAVRDWKPMLARLDAAIVALEAVPASTARDLSSETVAFCKWLREGQFTFLGMREYRLDGTPDTGELVGVTGSGLGILADPAVQVLRRGSEFAAMTPEVRRFFFAPQSIIITKASARSRVHRNVHMDYVGLKTYDDAGALKGELRIVGLFTSDAYTASPLGIPFLRLKVRRVLAEAGYPPRSHDGHALQHILETFPRDELFQIGSRQLSKWAAAILDLELRPRTRVFVRRDRFDRFVSILAYIPRDKFSTAIRERIGTIFCEVFEGRVSAYQPSFTQGPLVRVHFIIGRPGGGVAPAISDEELEARVSAAIRTWDDELTSALRSGPGGAALAARYAHAFSAGYMESFGSARALGDIARIERLSVEQPLAIEIYRDVDSGVSEARAAIYRLDGPMPLSERVPVFENLGFRVIDERTFSIAAEGTGGRREVALHEMRLLTFDGKPLNLSRDDKRFEACFLAVARGKAENDSFNRLVMSAGADWREAAVLRSYAAYLRQIRSPFGPRYIADTLDRHPNRTRDLLDLFRVRFDHTLGLNPDERSAPQNALRERFEAALSDVQSLDEDRILRQMLNVICATIRTNAFKTAGEGRHPEAMAFKFLSKDVAGAPEPRPFREIWVCAPRVEGIHLRFAPIARGGLRWSDRAQDFRTEVLGLARAQQVKNTVIVPQGAKGGFVPKQLPRGGSRDDIQKEGVAAYSLFVSSLLELTDNIVDGRTVSPPDLVRHDGDDPYLVVAADKGTATFSDTANTISARHDFWLGDAFASGGSAGYDHKKMGITARGAWECVKRHFRETDVDIQTQAFTVAGVGDMSGDVFGNGMLLSPAIRLVAAFDHRDIFLDPNPDAVSSYAERRRMFELPRSSWQDYDRSRISGGGGVFSRNAKSIPLTPEICRALSIDAVTATPAELMRAILASSVDLLWFGGIGTYVRASQESDADVGDRGNDVLRVTASELRAKVIGEGANLALTQFARIEFAGRGGRLNTDFIDNSAGVNSSDQEVNIKIALAAATQSGALDPDARKVLLASMTDDVATSCLRNNYEQSLALSVAQNSEPGGQRALVQLMASLEVRGLIDRKLEVLPSNVAIAQRMAQGKGLTRPELAVLMSYAKIALTEDLLASPVPDHPSLEPLLLGYFPQRLAADYPRDLVSHRLRREIIATVLTNRIVNQAGIAAIDQLVRETGRMAPDAVLAFLAAERAFSISALWDSVDALDGSIAGSRQLTLYADAQRILVERGTWFALQGLDPRHFDATVDMHAQVFRTLLARLPGILSPRRRTEHDTAVASYMSAGVPGQLAENLAAHAALAEASDIALVGDAAATADVTAAARAVFAIGDHFELSKIKSKARSLNLSDPYDQMATARALATISAGHRDLAVDLLATTSRSEPDIRAWVANRADAVERSRDRLVALASSGETSVSRLTVAAAEISNLARAAGG